MVVVTVVVTVRMIVLERGVVVVVPVGFSEVQEERSCDEHSSREARAVGRAVPEDPRGCGTEEGSRREDRRGASGPDAPLCEEIQVEARAVAERACHQDPERV